MLRLKAAALHCTPGAGIAPTTYSVDASEAGLPPGYWPKVVEVESPAEVWTVQLQSLNEEKAVYVLPLCPVRLVIFND